VVFRIAMGREVEEKDTILDRISERALFSVLN